MNLNNKRLEYFFDEGFRYVNVCIDGEKSVMSIEVANELNLNNDVILSVNDFDYKGEE